MALCLCRFLSLSCSFRRPPPSSSSQQRFFHSSLNLSSSNYYPNKRFCKFTAPFPFAYPKRFKASFSALSFSSVTSMENPPEGYRRNVGICLMNPSSKKIFAASRLDVPGSWQMPQGGIDESEDPREAAIRELREETGVVSAEVVAEVPYWLTYDFPPAVREKLNQQWGGDWKGQAQKWYLFKFSGNEDEINLLGDVTEKAEFGEWTWMPPEQVVDQVVDFKKPVYREVMSVFAPYLQ